MHSSFLSYLDQVARQGSIRKAASVLNVSSTSVNRKILSIENSLGIKLFDRSPEGVELTAAGKIVLEHCRKTLYDFDHVKTIIDDIRDRRTGHLSIRTIDSFTFSVLPRILEKFSTDYPGITLSIATAEPDEISAAVVAGEVDIGINFTKDLHPGVRIILEKSAPFGIIMRPDHPLAEKSIVEVSDLAGYPLVRTIDARGRNSILDQEMKSATNQLSTRIYTNALAVAKQSIINNRVLGIYTKIGFLEEILEKKLVFVPISLSSLSNYKIGCIISASSNMNPIRRLFTTAADSVLKTLKFDS